MPTKIYARREGEIVWASSGGDQLFTPTSLANGAGWQGARHDLYGALGAAADRYEWRVGFKLTGTPTVGDLIRVYLKTWDEGGGRGDNDDGTGDIAVSAEDKLRNLKYIGGGGGRDGGQRSRAGSHLALCLTGRLERSDRLECDGH